MPRSPSRVQQLAEAYLRQVRRHCVERDSAPVREAERLVSLARKLNGHAGQLYAVAPAGLPSSPGQVSRLDVAAQAVSALEAAKPLLEERPDDFRPLRLELMAFIRGVLDEAPDAA